MGQISMEILRCAGSALSGNQQSMFRKTSELACIVEHFEEVELLRGKSLHLCDSLRRVKRGANAYHDCDLQLYPRRHLSGDLQYIVRNASAPVSRSPGRNTGARPLAKNEPRSKDHDSLRSIFPRPRQPRIGAMRARDWICVTFRHNI